MTPTSPSSPPSPADRDARIRASLAERSGSIHDSLGDTGHAPDAIDATGIGHCRVVVPGAWAPQSRPS